MSECPTFEFKSESVRSWLWIVTANIQTQFKAWIFFVPNWILNVCGIVVQVIIFFLMAKYVGAGSIAAEYGGSYSSYLLVGLLINRLLYVSMYSYFNAYANGFWGSIFDLFNSHPLGVSGYVTGYVAFEHCRAFLEAVVYAVAIMLFTNLNFHVDDWKVLIAVGLLSLFTISGIGMISASTFTILNAKQFGSPIAWIVSILVQLTSGLYFPVSYVPKWAHPFGTILPQTYIYDAARRILISRASIADSVLQHDLYVLSIMAVILLPLGFILLRASLKSGEMKGGLSRWT